MARRTRTDRAWTGLQPSVRLARRRSLAIALPLAAALLLAGCTGGTAPTPSADASTTASASASASQSVPAASSAPPTATKSTPSSATPTTAAGGGPAQCRTAHLRGSWSVDGGAAGTLYGHLVLTNVGTTTCTLQGWPGVSLVGDGDGTQIGRAAAQDHSAPDAHPTVRLAPGAAARARVGIGTAADYSKSRCRPATADGFRVYPPGETASLFVRQRENGCRSTAVSLLQVQALVPSAR